MARKNTEVTNSKKGMNKDAHISTISEQEYSHAVNTNTEDGVGQGMVMLQNEPSNILCKNLPTGFRVIGHKVDATSNKTYFFLVNPTTGCSEIGEIPNINNVINVDDVFQECGCDINQILATPLETQTQIESCTYETILSDCECENEEGNKCLGFDVNFPMSVVLKDEKCGKVLYFTDDNNPRRRVELGNTSQYYKETIICEECDCGTEEIDVCINCEKLLVQPNFSVPEIEYEEVIGGNLKQGIYSFYVSYTDAIGNEMTRYMAVTPEIPIKDPSKNIYQQPELDGETNFSIRLKILNLDSRFDYYKIAIRQRTAVDGAVGYFETEAIPTGQNIYIYANSEGKKRSSAELIGLDYPIYKTAKTNESTNNKLFYTDLTTQEEINLQPVVNFIGQFMKWRTVAAEEDLFIKPKYAAKYKQFMRDETVPLSLRFFTDNGYYTANLPLISRIATPNDLFFDSFTDLPTQQQYIDAIESPSENWEKDVFSVLKYAKNCSVEERYQKWQFYNTASVTKTELFEDCGIEIPFDVKLVPVQRSCFSDIEEFEALNTSEFILLEDFETGEQFTTLQEWIDYDRENRLQILQDFPEFNPNTYASEFDCADSCELDELFPCETGDCCDVNPIPTTTMEFIGLEEFDNNVEKIEKDCADYKTKEAPSYCNAYKIGGAGDITNINACSDDTDNATQNDKLSYEFYGWVGKANSSGVNTEKKNLVFAREDSISGSVDEQNPYVIALNTPSYVSAHLSPLFPTLSYEEPANPPAVGTTVDMVANYASYPTEVIDTDDLYTEFYTTNVFTKDLKRLKEKFCASGIKFKNNNASGDVVNKAFIDTEYRVHNNVLWYEIDTSNEDSGVVINFSKTTEVSGDKGSLDCLMYPEEYRVTIYKDTPTTDDTNHILTQAISMQGEVICIDKAIVSTAAKIIIAVDTPIAIIKNTATYTVKQGVEEAVYVTGSRGCFTITAQRPDIVSIKYFGETKIRLRQECEYTAVCSYKVFDEIKCDPIPWEEGKFAYWESTEKYPDNNFLYDSSGLTIDQSDLPSSIKTEFNSIFLTNGELNENSVFKCKPIRHFKFPDNLICPIHDGVAEKSNINQSFKSNKIYPLGIHIDNDVINAFLNIAAKNNLITQEFRESIKGYEVFKGDIRLNTSVIAKGAMYDMYKYEENGKKQWFSNFPYNDLGANELLFKDESRKDYIPHPYNGFENIKFTFHSPETSFDKPNLPFEMKVEGYYLGNSRGRFSEVENHPTMVVLGGKAYQFATGLGTAEATLSLLLKISQSLLDTSQTMFAGTGSVSYGVATAWVAFALTTAQATVYFSTVDIFMKRYEWLKIFDENGTPYNFASYYSSVGYYNSLSTKIEEGQQLRGIKDKKYLGSSIYSFREQFEDVRINQLKRESSVYLSLGEDEGTNFPLKHSQSYYTYDNSRTFTGQTGLCNASDTNKTLTDEFDTRLYAPYVSLKAYIPNQHSTINSVQWLTTHYTGYLDTDNSCDVIMGGDVFLSRFAFKRKFLFFLNAMINESGAMADFSPFNYTTQRNVGFPRFFLDYKSDMSKDFGVFEMPDIKSEYNFDCRYEKGLYFRPPSKFYLWYYGIPSFIVESRINLNYRYGTNNKEGDFYPNQADYVAWTQESRVSIREDNQYHYRNLYSSDNELYGYRTLPANYDKDVWDCKSDHWDRTIYSEQDNNEQDVTDAFRVFRANNYYDFGNRFGKVYMLKNIESERVIGLFDNGAVIFNSFNTLEGSVEDIQIGSGNLFKTRPTEFFKSDLGYAGTQHRQFVSCEYGHYWVDAKRGRVHAVSPNGERLDEISRNGMRNWFRENLPFNIIKEFPDVDIDNPYKNIGIAMGWDSRYNRIFITKKDFKLIPKWKGQIELIDNDFILTATEEVIDVTNGEYFEDCSWTAAYNPLLKSWISFYTFTPNYYISHNNYFQTGINGENSSLWSHLLTNRSYQVFYGKKEKWEIEIPLKNSPIKKWYESIEYKLDVRRFSNEFDYNYRESNFNKAIVYNNRESTGEMNLVTGVANNMQQYINFPKVNSNSWDILAHNEDQTWNFNTLFDLVKDNHQQPLFYNTPSNADKTINNNAFNYSPRIKNRLRGEYASVILTQDKETRLKYIFEYLTNTHNQY